MMNKGQAIFIVLMLSLIVIAFFTIEPFFIGSKGESTTHAERIDSTDFPEYGLIPAALKEKMQALKAAHFNINYTYWYYFDVEDVNKHYYITDGGIKIIEDMPVNDPLALALVEGKMLDNPGKDMAIAQHPDMIMNPSASKEEREKKMKRFRAHQDNPGLYPQLTSIRYIFPADTANFSKLRVAIMAEDLSYHSMSMYQSEPYAYEAVDSLPVPVRGYVYFEKVMAKELMEHDVFTFYDLKGEVTVEFTVGSTASSPNIVEGFSTREDSYKAYQADGAFIKALNKLKVRWKPGKKGKAPVQVKIPLTFQVNGQKIKLLNQPPALADL